MGQRVNLQYTIDIDELPEETKKLISKSISPLDQARQHLLAATQSGDVLDVESLKEIDDARQSLMNVDYILQDIQNIIKGYLAHLSGANDSQEQVSQPGAEDPYGLKQSLDMDELQDKLTNFKQSFSDLKSVENEKPDQEQNA